MKINMILNSNEMMKKLDQSFKEKTQHDPSSNKNESLHNLVNSSQKNKKNLNERLIEFMEKNNVFDEETTEIDKEVKKIGVEKSTQYCVLSC